jgi:hypothetical protein
MDLIQHRSILSGQGPHITFKDWIDATPPPTWSHDNYNKIDLLCLIVQQIDNELGLSPLIRGPYIDAYAYVSSFLWRGVQLQLLSLSKPIDIKLVGADIAYWSFQLLEHKRTLKLKTQGYIVCQGE